MVEWQVILPSPMIKEQDCLIVIAYYQLQARIEITLRMDISSNLDYMILDTQCEGSKHSPTRITNIYNYVEPGEMQDPTYTTDRIANIQFHLDILTIITGDWNLHHNL